MTHYLLDTNICIHFMRNSFNMAQRIEEVGWQHLSISEITVAELLYGAERSNNIEKNYRIVQSFCREINVIPLSHTLELYAKHKAFLYKQGTPIEDLDLFIGCTAIAHNMILVTENVKHLMRIPGIEIENWIKR